MRNLLTLLLAVGLTTGCAPADPADPASGPHAVPGPDDRKADNYISTNAREFTLSGDVHVTLPENFAELEGDARAAELQRLAEAKLPSISRAGSPGTTSSTMNTTTEAAKSVRMPIRIRFDT